MVTWTNALMLCRAIRVFTLLSYFYRPHSVGTMADVEVTTAFNIPHAQDTDDSSDEDAVNTATSRVYMGPLQSPEKKLASNAGLPTPRRSTRASTSSNQSPLRRSSRLSNARTPDQVAEEDHESDSEDDGVVEPAVEDSTGEGTPEKDVLVDDGECLLCLRETCVSSYV